MEDFEKRKKDFIERYGLLVEECKCDFFAFPVYVPDNSAGDATFKTVLQQQVVDTSKMPQKSPFVVG